MTGCDANVLVQFVIQDNPIQSQDADAIVSSLSVQNPGWISRAALTELIWVISRKVRASRSSFVFLLEGLVARQEILSSILTLFTER